MSNDSSGNKRSFGSPLRRLFTGKKEDPELKSKFSTIYEQNLFRGKESISGPGSDLIQTAVLREQLPLLLSKHGIKSMIDAPCGDFYWMQHVDLKGIQYTGADIVQELVDKDNAAFANDARRFIVCDIVNGDLPKADVIFCRDCLVHLDNENAIRAIRNFKRSGSTYLLTTTFPSRTVNPDLGKIIWRPLNFRLAPFLFPEPVDTILENCTEDGGKYSDKSVCLWRLSDLNV